jgi:hypothetical protein
MIVCTVSPVFTQLGVGKDASLAAKPNEVFLMLDVAMHLLYNA